MKVIKLTSRTHENWNGRLVDESNYDELLDENTAVYKPDGSPLLILLKKAISLDKAQLAWSAIKTYHCENRNRGSASGVKMVNSKVKNILHKNEDRYVSKTSRAPKAFAVDSGAIGFLERNSRNRYCRACSWNRDHPDRWQKVLPLAQQVSSLFREHVPERWDRQLLEVHKTRPEYVIPGTVFTTITVNKNFRTACHHDAGDLPEGFSCMSLFRSGAWTGGNLVLPDFRIAAHLENRDLILFDPHEYHGNTQIVSLTKDYMRCSLVYYFRKKMIHCLSPEEEMWNAKTENSGPVFPEVEDEEE